MPDLELGSFKLPRLNLASPQFQANPYRAYDIYRAREPVHWGISQNPNLPGCWYLFRYSDVLAGLKDPRLGRERPGPSLANQSPDPFPVPNNDWLIYRDPPYHTGLRDWLKNALTQQLVEAFRPRLEDYALNLIGSFPPAGPVDFISQFAEKLPAVTLAGLLGFEPDKASFFARCAIFMLAPSWQINRSPFEQELAYSRAYATLSHLLRDLVAERKSVPRPDLMTRLIFTQQQFRAFDEAELVSNALLFLITGYHVAVNLLGNGWLALLEHPAQVEKWRAGILRPGPAVEELLRYESPLQMVDRWVLQDLEICGKNFRRGDRVYLILGAANRDPARFQQPGNLELDREKNIHLAFGAGLHTCLGANFVRLQAAVAFNLLLERLGNLETVGPPPSWQTNPNFRALNRLLFNYTLKEA